MTNVLIFTEIEKLGYKSNATTGDSMDGNKEIAEWLKELIETEYGISQEKMTSDWLCGAEAMNGDLLYIHIVSENQETTEKVYHSLEKANVQYRDDLDKWIEKEKIQFIETDGFIGTPDEYWIEIN